MQLSWCPGSGDVSADWPLSRARRAAGTARAGCSALLPPGSCQCYQLCPPPGGPTETAPSSLWLRFGPSHGGQLHRASPQERSPPGGVGEVSDNSTTGARNPSGEPLAPQGTGPPSAACQEPRRCSHPVLTGRRPVLAHGWRGNLASASRGLHGPRVSVSDGVALGGIAELTGFGWAYRQWRNPPL